MIEPGSGSGRSKREITESVLNRHNIKGEQDALPGMGADPQPSNAG